MLLTADGDPPPPLHGGAVTVVRVARDVVHVASHVVDDRDHVARHLLSDQAAGDV